MTGTPPAKPPLSQQLRSFPPTFWVANLIELIERFSFWGIRVIAALYIVAPAEKGGLDLSNTDKGFFFFVWSLIQCLLPMFTGGFSDRYGYRKSLMVAFGINMAGYGLMGYTHTWWGFLAACCLVGTGTAIFKPPLHGTLAHCVNESNSSVGWGMFYLMVNIGGFVGPIVCGYLRLLQWRYAFLAAAAIIVLNILVTGLFLKDYAKEAHREGGKPAQGPAQVFLEAMATLKDLRFVVFLAIFSGFYFMFMQLFDQLAIFIDQWVNSNDLATFLARSTGTEFFKNRAANGGQLNPEWITDVDAGAILVLVLFVSYITGKFRHISAMIFGMFAACLGLILAGTATAGWAVVLGILVFAIGEMACVPKFQEYIGLMAPPDKKALYMGYSNIPFAVGWSLANLLGGRLYDRLSDLYGLGRDYLVTQLGQDSGTVASLSKGEVLSGLAEALGQDERAVRRLLWEHYHPQNFWYICIGIGLLATLAMVGYHFWLKQEAQRPR